MKKYIVSDKVQTVRLAKEQELAKMQSDLVQFDADSVRPLRAIANGVATDADRQKLADLEAKAAPLRPKVAALQKELGLI